MFRQHLLAVVVFVGMLVLVFHRAIFFGEVLAPVDLLSKELPWRAVLPRDVPIVNFTTADVFSVFHPWKHFVHDELQAGRFPLWCRYVGCGYPLAGQGCIKLFGLTTLFLWRLPPGTAALCSFFSQLLVAMTGMYALLGALRLRWSAAVFGGLVYGLNSAMFQDLEFEHITGALMMLPWICWALWRRARSDRAGGRWWSLAGLFFGLAILNGSLQSSAMVWVSAAAFAAVALWREQHSGWFRKSLATVALFSILGVLIGAIALLPNLELFSRNSRPRFEHIHWVELMWKRPLALLPWAATLMNPDAIGNYQTFDMMRALGRMGTAATTPVMSDLRVYCGLAALVLALFGLRKRSGARSLGIMLVLAPLIVAVATPLYLILYFRVLAAAACGIATLAALGLERICETDERLGRDARMSVTVLAIGIGLAVVVGTAVTARRAPLTRKAEQIGLAGTSIYKADVEWQKEKARATVDNFSLRGRAVARFSVLAALLAVALILAPRHSTGVALACIILNTGDLLELAWRTFPSVPRSFEYPTTPALEFLRSQPGRFRVASLWDAASNWPTARANLLMPYKLEDPRVYESLIPANPFLQTNDWDALNVKFLVVPPHAKSPRDDWRLVFSHEVDIYENPHCWPRAWFTTDLNSAPVESLDTAIAAYESGTIRVTAQANRAGWVVVGERNYPGWRATVDGRPAELREAQGLWQAVAMAPGRHEISLTFQPDTVRWGAALTLVGLLATATCWRLWKKG